MVYNVTGKLAAKPTGAHVVARYCEGRGVTVLGAAFWDAVLDEMTAANLTLIFGVNFVSRSPLQPASYGMWIHSCCCRTGHRPCQPCQRWIATSESELVACGERLR